MSREKSIKLERMSSGLESLTYTLQELISPRILLYHQSQGERCPNAETGILTLDETGAIVAHTAVEVIP